MLRWLEGVRFCVPATSFYAGYRYDDYLFCRRQDRQVQSAILLGADQFLAVEQQHRLLPKVFKLQFWHRAAGAQFRVVGPFGIPAA